MSKEGLVLSLCDFTGNMVKPWAKVGYECICIDIQHKIRKPRFVKYEGGGSILYIWGDIRSWTPPIDKPIRIIFAFPPCTDLTVSGARDFQTKRGYRLSDAIELFDACTLIGEYSRKPYMIENPIGRLNTHRRKPDAIFHPYQYAGYQGTPTELYTKATCIWIGNHFSIPQQKPIEPTQGSKMHLMPPSENRANLRSETPMGFAQAVFQVNQSYGNHEQDRLDETITIQPSLGKEVQLNI